MERLINRTLILQQAVLETVAARDDHRRGWSSAMQRFAEYPATLFFTG